MYLVTFHSCDLLLKPAEPGELFCKNPADLSLYYVNTSYLLMVWAEDDPAAKTVTQVDNSSAADETDNIWESCPQCQDENLKIAPDDDDNRW